MPLTLNPAGGVPATIGCLRMVAVPGWTGSGSRMMRVGSWAEAAELRIARNVNANRAGHARMGVPSGGLNSGAAPGLAVVGGSTGVGTLLVPRSHTFTGRLATVLGRIGARHPAPFSGWLVPFASVLWLSALLLAGVWIFRSPPDDD